MPADRSAPSGPKPGASASAISVALLGNPNTGKSCIFSALCGIRQRTGNYAGVTVEEKLGETHFGGHRFTLMDLPGTYSLSAISLDEAVTVDALLGRRENVSAPQVLLCVVDATNLSRNLYLVSQALEIGLPMVVALNKTDLAEELGIRLDVQELSRRLGVAVVPTQAHRAAGMDHLREKLLAAVGRSAPEQQDPFPELFRQEEQTLASRIRDQAGQPDVPDFLLRRLLLDRDGYLEQAEPPLILSEVRTAVEQRGPGWRPQAILCRKSSRFADTAGPSRSWTAAKRDGRASRRASVIGWTVC